MSNKEMNSVIIEHNAKSYNTPMALVRPRQHIYFESNSIRILFHYKSPIHGGKEVKHHGKR
jgi:hypothetical protein